MKRFRDCSSCSDVFDCEVTTDLKLDSSVTYCSRRDPEVFRIKVLGFRAAEISDQIKFGSQASV